MRGKIYEISVENGELKILGLPGGARVVSYHSRVARQLKKIRVSESLLHEAREALQEWPKHTSSPILQNGLVALAVGNYFACFAKNSDTSFKLDAKNVFKGNAEAYQRHQDWRKIRDEHFHHLGPTGRSFAYCIAISEDNEFIDGICVGMTIPVSQIQSWIQLLFQLIHVALKALDEKAEAHFQKINIEISDLSIDEIGQLSRLEMPKPKIG